MAEAFGVHASQQHLPLPLGYVRAPSWPNNRQRPRTVHQQTNYANLLPVRDVCVHAAGIPMVARKKGPAICSGTQRACYSLNQKTTQIKGDKLRDLEISTVPQQFASTQAQLLLELVNRETEAQLQQLKSAVPASRLVPNTIPKSKQTILKKRHSESFHYQPPDLGRVDFENWLKKRNKKRQPSQHVVLSAFGRTIGNDLVNQKIGKRSDESNENYEKNRYSTKGMKSARKDVMDKLHNYRINAQARLLLEKRAVSYMKEREERLEAAVQKSMRK
ncbi:hypothetical protein O6H91_04G008000 [Diphasiastrum complanatum]|uniref:Uncharacterized protein n=1 Tax=Diphasiastrum complanatum TaxID=34168 RepID=A0ACC2DUB0_DIPCM|nr:hypothetical protein O6H91_04G008000 [Diphasiastrum complanatum]